MQPVPHDIPTDFHTRRPAHRRIPILTIDGGGIRGIIPCKVLKKITELTNQCAADLFRLQAGTSTGAIITLGLNVPDEKNPEKPKYDVDQILDLYRNSGKSIFPDYYCKRVWSLTHPKYDGSGLTETIDHYFRDTLMSESIGNVVVTSYDADRGESRCFTKQNPGEPDLKMSSALLRSTAAPTFFPSQEGPEGQNFLDGGLSANNPSMVAFTSAVKMYSANEFLFCSLGTGKAFSSISYSDSKNWGQLQWADGERILNILFDSQAAEVDKMMRNLYPSDSERKGYFRFQIDVDPEHASLDDASNENIEYLEGLGDQLIEEKEEDLRALAAALEETGRAEAYSTNEEHYS